jgi:hypothetical protein
LLASGGIYFLHHRHGGPFHLAEQRGANGTAPHQLPAPVVDEHCTMELRSDGPGVVSVTSFQLNAAWKVGSEAGARRHAPKGTKMATGRRKFFKCLIGVVPFT